MARRSDFVVVDYANTVKLERMGFRPELMQLEIISHPKDGFTFPQKINSPGITATRITNPIKLVNNSFWWNVPNFLITEQSEIPKQDNFTTIEDTEKQNDVVTMTVVEEKISGDSEAIVCSKIGPFEKLLQVSCFV